LPRKSFEATSLPFSSVVLKSGDLSFTSMEFLLAVVATSQLYRNGLLAVTLAASVWVGSSWLVAQAPTTQFGRKADAVKGRARWVDPDFAEGQGAPDSDCHHDGWKIL